MRTTWNGASKPDNLKNYIFIHMFYFDMGYHILFVFKSMITVFIGIYYLIWWFLFLKVLVIFKGKLKSKTHF